MAKKWIAGAIERPGAFTKKAKKAGKSVAEYAQEKKGASGRTGKQARLAITLKKMCSKMPEGGTLSPKGDIGELRQKEAVKLGGFGDGAIVSASSYLPVRKHAAAKGDR